jgi:methylenetetrahydrofolate dehydrogenase (NADP+)/methenyltetrahydrofolate cyclohydrolase
MALLALQKKTGANGTVTVCHSGTDNLAEFTRLADVLVAAIGRPEFVTADMVKPGAVVIDVGMNRVPDASKKSGYRLTGDVHFPTVSPLVSQITPVPGGVGPMTVAMLMKNTLKAYHLQSAR